MKRIFILMCLLTSSFGVYGMDERELKDKVKEAKIDLTKEEQTVLENGELGTTRYVLGGILGVYPGFGIGHAVQGRWTNQGWKFTVGQTAGLVLMVAGTDSCLGHALDSNCSGGESGTMFAGVMTFMVFKIWEMIEVWYGGYRQMGDYTYLESKILKSEKPKTSFFILPEFQTNSVAIKLGLNF